MRSHIKQAVIAIALFALPIAALMLFRMRNPPISIPDFYKVDGEHYKDAVTILTASSSTLITISISIAAATGFLLINLHKKEAYSSLFFAAVAVSTSVTSIYYSVELSRWSAFSVAISIYSLDRLSDILVNQALFTLFSSAALMAMLSGVEKK